MKDNISLSLLKEKNDGHKRGSSQASNFQITDLPLMFKPLLSRLHSVENGITDQFGGLMSSLTQTWEYLYRQLVLVIGYDLLLRLYEIVVL